MFKTPFAAGSFQLTIDGSPSTAYIKSVDGGFARAAIVEEAIGPDNLRVKHTSVAEIDPLSFEVGFAGSVDILKWIQASWLKDFRRRSGEVAHADVNRKGMTTQSFTDALIIETTFPALDALSQDTAYLKFKILPEVVDYAPDTAPLSGRVEAPQKQWALSAFRLVLDGVETRGVHKIESFTVKQGVKKLYVGRKRFPEIEPTKIEFPNLVAHIAEANAGPIWDWYRAYVQKGDRDPSQQRSGALEFLAPDRKTVLLRVQLFEVGLASASVAASQANQRVAKSVKFELYVGRMELDLANSKGLQ